MSSREKMESAACGSGRRQRQEQKEKEALQGKVDMGCMDGDCQRPKWKPVFEEASSSSRRPLKKIRSPDRSSAHPRPMFPCLCDGSRHPPPSPPLLPSNTHQPLGTKQPVSCCALKKVEELSRSGGVRSALFSLSGLERK